MVWANGNFISHVLSWLSRVRTYTLAYHRVQFFLERMAQINLCYVFVYAQLSVHL